MFATLDPTVRKAKFGEIDALLTDTVGFIKDIPTNLIEAFKSTLESAVFSDLNLIILDATGDWQNELEVTRSTISSLGSTTPEILVFNKCDLVSDFSFYPLNAVFISAKTGFGLENLYETICNFFKNDFVKMVLKVTYADYGKLTSILNLATKYEVSYLDTEVLVDLTVRKMHADKFYKYK